MEPKYNGKAREFTIEDIKYIGEEVTKGTKITTLAKEFRVGCKRILKTVDFYTYHILPRPSFKAVGIIQKTLGAKTQPYYETEKEMLKTPKYTWNSLSKSERNFYLKYEKERQQGCSRVNQTLE
jgi:hypothetical protein